MPINDWWQRYKYQLLGVVLGIFTHLLVFVLAAITGEGGGALILLYADFPFWILAKSLSLGPKYLWGLCLLGGTLLYAAMGYFFAKKLSSKHQ